METTGLTVVAYIEEQRDKFSKQIKEIMKSAVGFIEAPRLHLILLGLFDEKRRTNPYCTKLTIEKVKQFFIEDKKQHFKPFEVELNLIRPGVWYDDKGKPRYLLGGGTVVAMGDLHNRDTRNFAKLGQDLASHLKYKLPAIFDCNYKRKFDTVWCKLGYFDKDFEISNSLKQTFDLSQNFDEKVKIDKFDIVGFRKKSLLDGETIESIPLLSDC